MDSRYLKLAASADKQRSKCSTMTSLILAGFLAQYSFNLHAMLQDTLEILHFLKPSRQHIKEGLVPDCSKSLLGGGQAFEDMAFLQSSQGMNNNSLHFSPEVVKALIGEPLTEEDLLKVCHKGINMTPVTPPPPPAFTLP